LAPPKAEEAVPALTPGTEGSGRPTKRERRIMDRLRGRAGSLEG
jgi:hypothetical protein